MSGKNHPWPGLITLIKIALLAAVGLLAACGGGGSSSGSGQNNGGVANVLPVSVERWPSNTAINTPFVSVTVCVPGTTNCETVDHVLLDTGSYGLRLHASALGLASSLPAVNNATGEPVAECAQFVNGYTWGSVRRADVQLSGETARNLPVQIIADPDSPYTSIPDVCQRTGANSGATVPSLKANGILGIGLFNQDCVVCTVTTSPGLYYACTASGCTGTLLPLSAQVVNPVPALATDNNGVAVVFPDVAQGGVTSLSGALVFGIGTQSNNQLGTATTIILADALGNFTTTYKNTSFNASFIDSGSNGIFFTDSSFTACSGFYCPSATLAYSAVNTSPINGVNSTVNFTVEDASSIRSNKVAAHLAGPFPGAQTFDWGLPFFFGRTVFLAISGASTPNGTGPYWAY